LLKTVSASRLTQALDKVRRRLNTTAPSNTDCPNYIVLKVDREKRKFVLVDISCLETYGNYVRVWQGDQVILVSNTLKQCLQQLPQHQFVQVHKSFVVNKQQVMAVDNKVIRLNGDRFIKVGKSFKDHLLDLL
tara:strand:+ start:35194 stop:35592 length:399 start_codon:yes stop_codon:yes gene_type:complete